MVLKNQPPRDFQCQGLAGSRLLETFPSLNANLSHVVGNEEEMASTTSCQHRPSSPVGASRVARGKKNMPDNAGAAGDRISIFGLGRSPGGGNCYLLQYSCLGNTMDRSAWQAIVQGVTKSLTQLNN